MAKGRASTPDDTSHQFQASGSSKPVIRSPYFPSQQLWELISDIEIRLGHELELISYPVNVTHVYNPIDYASELHRAYLQKFLKKRPRVLFLGMNPGPFGMCQTGVPFGNVQFVREWMELTGTVRKPIKEHHSRPINGLNCTRTEKSGELFWGLLEEVFNDAEHFFRFGFVHNLCPLAYMNKAGANITPAEFRGDVRKQFEEIILRYLQEALQLLQPNVIVSLGRYVERLVNILLKNNCSETITHIQIKHPSQRVPKNQNWKEEIHLKFIETGLLEYWK